MGFDIGGVFLAFLFPCLLQVLYCHRGGYVGVWFNYVYVSYELYHSPDFGVLYVFVTDVWNPSLFLYPVISCYILLYPVISCYILLYPVISCYIISGNIDFSFSVMYIYLSYLITILNYYT